MHAMHAYSSPCRHLGRGARICHIIRMASDTNKNKAAAAAAAAAATTTAPAAAVEEEEEAEEETEADVFPPAGEAASLFELSREEEQRIAHARVRATQRAALLEGVVYPAVGCCTPPDRGVGCIRVRGGEGDEEMEVRVRFPVGADQTEHPWPCAVMMAAVMVRHGVSALLPVLRGGEGEREREEVGEAKEGEEGREGRKRPVSVLELGAGVGLPGYALAAAAAATVGQGKDEVTVVITDRPEAQAAFQVMEQVNSDVAKWVRSCVLRWGHDRDRELLERMPGVLPLDMVLCSDLLYHGDDATQQLLVQTLAAICAPRTLIVSLHEKRWGDHEGCMAPFAERLGAAGFHSCVSPGPLDAVLRTLFNNHPADEKIDIGAFYSLSFFCQDSALLEQAVSAM